MFAAHIIGHAQHLSRIGRGSADEARLRSNLTDPNALFWIGTPRDDQAAAILDALALRRAAWEAGFDRPGEDGWYRVGFASFCEGVMHHVRPIAYTNRSTIETIERAMSIFELGQHEIAGLIGCHPAKVSRMLKGKGEISYAEFGRLLTWGHEMGHGDVFGQ